MTTTNDHPRASDAYGGIGIVALFLALYWAAYLLLGWAAEMAR